MAIKVSQTYVVAAPKEIVMESMTDPQVLKFCVPKCRAVRSVAANMMRVSAQVTVLTRTYQMDGLVRFDPIENDAGYDVKCTVTIGPYQIGEVEGSVLFEELADSTSVRSDAVIKPARRFNPVIEKLAEPLARSLSGAFFKRFGIAVAERL